MHHTCIVHTKNMMEKTPITKNSLLDGITGNNQLSDSLGLIFPYKVTDRSYLLVNKHKIYQYSRQLSLFTITGSPYLTHKSRFKSSLFAFDTTPSGLPCYWQIMQMHMDSEARPMHDSAHLMYFAHLHAIRGAHHVHRAKHDHPHGLALGTVAR